MSHLLVHSPLKYTLQNAIEQMTRAKSLRICLFHWLGVPHLLATIRINTIENEPDESPMCQTKAIHRRSIMRKACSTKKLPGLLSTLEVRYIDSS